MLNNVLGTNYVNNGYRSGGQAQYHNYFYPQAHQNFLASINLKW